MSIILTTKRYLVNTSKGQFKLFLSRHSDGTYFAGVLWYRKTGSWAKEQEVNLDFDLQNFADTSEDVVLKEATAWVKKHLDPNAEVVLGKS